MRLACRSCGRDLNWWRRDLAAASPYATGLTEPTDAMSKIILPLDSEWSSTAIAALTAFIDKHAALLADPAVRYFIFMERALVYLKLKETRLALKDYELLQAENADRALIYWRMGDARRIDGDFADAARFFELVADKINSPSNTAEEKRHLANWPYTLSHAHWRVGRVQKALEVVREARDRRIVPFVDMRPDPLTGESRDWGQLTFTNCLVYYLWDLARVEKRDPGPTEIREYEDAHLLLKEHQVDNGAHWEPLDTLLIVTEALNRAEETLRYTDQLEGMIVYDNEGRVRVRLKSSVGFELKDVPIEEIEMLRAHIHHARVKFGKRTSV